jgi:hypothetical protein
MTTREQKATIRGTRAATGNCILIRSTHWANDTMRCEHAGSDQEPGAP